MDVAELYARDKDACSSHDVGARWLPGTKTWKTLWDTMIDLYEKYGYYKRGLSTMTLKGIDGAAQIQQMSDMRNNPKKTLGGFEVLTVRLQRGYKKRFKDRGSDKNRTSGFNVYIMELSDNAWCCVAVEQSLRSNSTMESKAPLCRMQRKNWKHIKRILWKNR